MNVSAKFGALLNYMYMYITVSQGNGVLFWSHPELFFSVFSSFQYVFSIFHCFMLKDPIFSVYVFHWRPIGHTVVYLFFYFILSNRSAPPLFSLFSIVFIFLSMLSIVFYVLLCLF